jgi:ribonuclease Z
LFGLLLTIGTNGRETPLTLIGPTGIRNMVETVLMAQGGLPLYQLEFVEIETDASLDLGMITDGIKVSIHPLKHRITAFGYVFEEPSRPGALNAARAVELGARGRELGKLKRGLDVTLEDGTIVRCADVLSASIPGARVAFLQDTADSSAAREACMGCDLMIHEATYDECLREKAVLHGHSTANMAGAFAAECKAKMLILTHFSARYMIKRPHDSSDEKSDATEPPKDAVRFPRVLFVVPHCLLL